MLILIRICTYKQTIPPSKTFINGVFTLLVSLKSNGEKCNNLAQSTKPLNHQILGNFNAKIIGL